MNLQLDDQLEKQCGQLLVNNANVSEREQQLVTAQGDHFGLKEVSNMEVSLPLSSTSPKPSKTLQWSSQESSSTTSSHMMCPIRKRH